MHLRKDILELQAKLTDEERQRETADSIAAAEVERLRQQTSGHEENPSDDEQQREAACSAAASELRP